MSLKIGIVGLPNVGKSTLFKALTNKNILIKNYPFATINPNFGVSFIDDERLFKIGEIFKSKKIVKNFVNFVDIAGLIKNASKGEGLGNAFLSNIKMVDALIHVVRCFENKDIIHVENKINPLSDIEIINLELMIHDLESIKKMKANLNKKSKNNIASKEIKAQNLILDKFLNCLENEKLLNTLTLNKEELKIIRNFQLLTLKPQIILANINGADNLHSNSKQFQYLNDVKNYCLKTNCQLVVLDLELELLGSELSKEENQLMHQEYKLNDNLQTLISKSHKILNLATFFTAGEKETRAWTFLKECSACECAKIIHSDIQKGFIKVEVYNYNDLIKYKTFLNVKNHGLLSIEGKNYIIKDGDICYFRFNI